MTLNEYTEVLEEGIVFFKNSKRIEALAQKISKKINMLSKPEEKKEIAEVVNQLLEMSEEFKLLETEKRNRKNKYLIMKKYYTLEEKYNDIIKIINKESIISAIKKLSLASIFSALLFVSFDFFQEYGVSTNIYKGVALDKSALDIADDTFKKISDDGGLNRMKMSGEFQRGMAKTVSSMGDKLGEKGAAAKEEADLYLAGEKAISGVLAGTTAVSAGIFYKLFESIFGSVRKNSLYHKTRMTLEKLGKLK